MRRDIPIEVVEAFIDAIVDVVDSMGLDEVETAVAMAIAFARMRAATAQPVIHAINGLVEYEEARCRELDKPVDLDVN